MLRYEGNNLAIIEAKKFSKDPLDGLSQGIEYAKILNVPFVYSSNGEKIYEYDIRSHSGEYIIISQVLKSFLIEFMAMSKNGNTGF